MEQSKPTITSTQHILPFERLSPVDFERMCLWLVEREGYKRARHLGLGGSEQGRDVVAYKPTPKVTSCGTSSASGTSPSELRRSRKRWTACPGQHARVPAVGIEGNGECLLGRVW